MSDEETYSVIFASLKHPLRRKLLTILASGPKSFTDILQQVDIGSAHLRYHLEGLDGLHPYLKDLLHEEIDVDRIDYLSREGYHIGNEYHFGPDSSIQKMRVHRVPIVSSKEMNDLEKNLARESSHHV